MNRSQFKEWFSACRKVRNCYSDDNPRIVGDRDGVQFRQGYTLFNGLVRTNLLNNRGDYFLRFSDLQSATGKAYRRLALQELRFTRIKPFAGQSIHVLPK